MVEETIVKPSNLTLLLVLKPISAAESTAAPRKGAPSEATREAQNHPEPQPYQCADRFGDRDLWWSPLENEAICDVSFFWSPEHQRSPPGTRWPLERYILRTCNTAFCDRVGLACSPEDRGFHTVHRRETRVPEVPHEVERLREHAL